MRNVIMLLCLSLLACGAPATPPEAVRGAAAGLDVGCIDATRIAGRRAEGSRALIFEMSDGRVIRNDLSQVCPGIDRASRFGTLAVDAMESRLCRGDFVRVYDLADAPVGGIKSLPRCRLGNFTQVAPDSTKRRRTGE